MERKSFKKGSYWYFQPIYNYLGGHEYASYEDAERSIKGVLESIGEKFSEGKIRLEDTQIDYARMESRDVKYQSEPIKFRMGKDYAYPLVLFAKEGKLLVSVSSEEYYEDDDSESKVYANYRLSEDFVIGDYNTDEDIRIAVEKKFGIKSPSLHYLSFRNLDITTNTDGIPREFESEDDLEGYPKFDWQDVLLCTDWDGEVQNISLDNGERLEFVEPNSFYQSEIEGDGRYINSSILEMITSEIGSYYIWGMLLYHLIGWEKMRID